VWQGEYDVDIADRQKVTAARFQPAVPGVGLALRAVPVSTGNGDVSITCLMESIF
jgi:hypothetical protein